MKTFINSNLLIKKIIIIAFRYTNSTRIYNLYIICKTSPWLTKHQYTNDDKIIHPSSEDASLSSLIIFK